MAIQAQNATPKIDPQEECEILSMITQNGKKIHMKEVEKVENKESQKQADQLLEDL